MVDLTMKKASKNKLIGTTIVPAGLAIVLVPYSLLLGWNGPTLVLFWLVITPVLAVNLPRLVSNKGSYLIQSLVGLIIFYAFMVFMIYDHYKTDYFMFMMISFVVNVVVVSVTGWVRSQIKLEE